MRLRRWGIWAASVGALAALAVTSVAFAQEDVATQTAEGEPEASENPSAGNTAGAPSEAETAEAETAEAETAAAEEDAAAAEEDAAEAAAEEGAAEAEEGASEGPTVGPTAEEEAEASGPAAQPGVLEAIDGAFGTYVVTPMVWVLFYDVVFWDNEDPDAEAWPYPVRFLFLGAAAADKNINLPFIVLWLVLGAIFFTLRMRFVNLWGFKHALLITAGRFDDDEEEGEVTHFQALSSALSATVGLGNIAGVAIAVSTGGPGAVFWMVVAGFLGMSSKFTECTLGQMYRRVDDAGRVSGGPMRYLSDGLKGLGQGRLGKVLAGMFALMCIGGSFGGGNMFQANQAFAQTSQVLPFIADKSWLFGLIMAVLVGLVIIGGIKRIGQVAGAVVPAMCAVYVVAGLAILVANAGDVPAAFGRIVGQAFTFEAGLGGFFGVLITGFQRAAFSNEAGIGSASIAHSAASTNEPVREGLVALLEPFIDTIVICTMTGLVVVVTGVYRDAPAGADGVLLTSTAFESVFSWFPYVLTVAVLLFAFSTMISWSYYGERCWAYLFGQGSSVVYRVIFLCFVVLGAILQLDNVVTFSDLMILGMAFPNVLGLVLLSSKVRAALVEYWDRFGPNAQPPPTDDDASAA